MVEAFQGRTTIVDQGRFDYYRGRKDSLRLVDDYYYLMKFLDGNCFPTDDDVKEVVKDWLSSQAADICNLRIQKIAERYKKYLNIYGIYVEKYRNVKGVK